MAGVGHLPVPGFGEKLKHHIDQLKAVRACRRVWGETVSCSSSRVAGSGFRISDLAVLGEEGSGAVPDLFFKVL